MKKGLLYLLFISGFVTPIFSQQPSERKKELQRIDTSTLDLKKFAESITGTQTDNFEKAKVLLYWLSENFEWKATDYKTRTVKEIIARNGGNCFELARVYMALIKESGIQYRGVAEINIHVYSERRHQTAMEMVEKNGNKASVFGLQHNDHRWVEIFNDKTNRWEPADPSMGVIGMEDWLKARVWFGQRKTIDTAISNQMIVPFAIFFTGTDNKLQDSRAHYYLIEQFDNLYEGRLSKSPEWSDWVSGINTLSITAKNAFSGEENLHNHLQRIDNLLRIYLRLKERIVKK